MLEPRDEVVPPDKTLKPNADATHQELSLNHPLQRDVAALQNDLTLQHKEKLTGLVMAGER